MSLASYNDPFEVRDRILGAMSQEMPELKVRPEPGEEPPAIYVMVSAVAMEFAALAKTLQGEVDD